MYALLRPDSWTSTALEQGGVLTRAQALRGGMSASAWRWRLDSGDWRVLTPGVAVTHDGPVTEEQLRWAAVLASGPRAALTGDVALRAWGMRIEPSSVWRVATGDGFPRPRRELGAGGSTTVQVQVHQVQAFDALVHPVRQPRLLRPPAAVLHAAAWAPNDQAASWRLAAAVQQRLVSPAQVRAAVEHLPRLPRRSLTAAVLDDVELGAHAGNELDLRRLLRVFRLPLPDRLQLQVRQGQRLSYLDAWWERQRVVLEADGAQHLWTEEYGDDCLRSNDVALALRGRSLQLRATTMQIRLRHLRLVDQLRSVLL